MMAKKIQWKTVDDESTKYPKNTLSYSVEGGKIALEAQRIRVFKVDFSASSDSTDQSFLQ